jgi:hypothetical protein
MNQPLTIRVFGRRRNVLVDRPYQHRLSLMTSLMALLPPALFFGIYSLITAEGSRRIVEASPALEDMVRIQNRTESLMILAAVLFYGVGVYLVTLLESHRTAGFIHRVNGRLGELMAGQYSGRITPRREDHFHYLADTVNRLGTSLEQRSAEDLAALDDLSQSLDAVVLGLGATTEGRTGPRLEEVRSRLEAMRRLKAGQIERPISADGEILTVHDGPADSSEPSSAAETVNR